MEEDICQSIGKTVSALGKQAGFEGFEDAQKVSKFRKV